MKVFGLSEIATDDTNYATNIIYTLRLSGWKQVTIFGFILFSFDFSEKNDTVVVSFVRLGSKSKSKLQMNSYLKHPQELSLFKFHAFNIKYKV